MAITEAQRAIITATVPILRTGGEALTTHFYKMLFRDFPAVKAFFNPAHQTTGAQPRALANSVLHYAENIDDLSKLDPTLVQQIIQKHVALQVMPEHYPIVGQCLLKSIREVLGEETATDAVIDAWAAAYGQLADILIGAEGAIYKQLLATEGGWNGARSFTLAKKVAESETIASFYLAPTDGKAVIKYQPGQYIGLQLYIPNKEDGAVTEVRRNYSLSQAADGKTLRITVKREEGGVVSNWLHQELKEGATINVLPPAGYFVLPATVTKNVLLLSAGVGITPTVAMLQSLAQEGAGTTVHFVNFSRSAKVQAFAKDVETIAATAGCTVKPHFFLTESNTNGSSANPDAAVESVRAAVVSTVADPAKDLTVFLLGPKSFMATMRKGLVNMGVPAEKIQYEFFGPAAALE